MDYCFLLNGLNKGNNLIINNIYRKEEQNLNKLMSKSRDLYLNKMYKGSSERKNEKNTRDTELKNTSSIFYLLP